MSFPPEIRPMPSRFRNPVGKYRIHRGPTCIHCGLCADLCPRGVHRRLGKKMLPPKDEFCIGPSCQEKDYYCISRCPQGALRMAINANLKAFTDYRWPADLLLATWQQAETGKVPYADLEYRVGSSRGGFDRLRLRLPREIRLSSPEEEIFTAVGRDLRREVPMKRLDPQYGFVNLVSALASTQVWFNSAFHRDAFQAAAKALLAKMPDFVPPDLADSLSARSRVMPPGVNLKPFDFNRFIALISVEPHDDLVTALNRSLIAISGFLNFTLKIAALDGVQYPAHGINFVDVVH